MAEGSSTTPGVSEGVGARGVVIGSSGSGEWRGVDLGSSGKTAGTLEAIGLEVGEFEVLRRFGARASGEWPDDGSAGPSSPAGGTLDGRMGAS